MNTERVVVLFFALMTFFNSSAQEYKKLENNVQLGCGAACFGRVMEDMGFAYSFGYGLGIRVKQTFSIMPMVEYRETVESMFGNSMYGGDKDMFKFVDFSAAVRWHLTSGKTRVVLGLAPYLSWALERDSHSIMDPSFKFHGMAKIKPLDFGLMPSISFDVCKHFSLGGKANIGLLDAAHQARDISYLASSRHLVSFEAFLRARF